MAFSLPSLPKLPTSLPGANLVAPAILNAVSVIAKFLPNLNPPRPIYAILNVKTYLPLTIPDSYAEITPRFAEYQISDYPVEDGGFMAANKVRRPVQVDVTLVKEGSDLARLTWLEAIRQQLASDPLARYHILTPNGLFQNLTITGLSFNTRRDRGQNLLYLDAKFSEVPDIPTSSLVGEKAKADESKPTEDAGRVFPTDTPTATQSLVNSNPYNLPPSIGD